MILKLKNGNTLSIEIQIDERKQDGKHVKSTIEQKQNPTKVPNGYLLYILNKHGYTFDDLDVFGLF